MNPAANPSPKRIHALAYDSTNQRTVLFGGYDGVDYYDDTWIYDLAGNTWTNLYRYGDQPVRLFEIP